MTKISILGFLIAFSFQIVFSQQVDVEVITDKKKVASILKKENTDLKYNKLYFSEIDKCRSLLRSKSLKQAELSCQKAISYAEKLPKDRRLERSAAHTSMAIALMHQERFTESIQYLNKSLELRNLASDDSDADTGDIYFLLGQANHLQDKTENAKDFYAKAEVTYRAAFKEMKELKSEMEDFLLKDYANRIVRTIETHIILLGNAGLKEEAERLENHLITTKKEFASYL